MVWADVTATGVEGDGLDFRLVIEGSRVQFCTAGLAAGRCYGASVLPAPGSVTWTGTGGSPVITTGQTDPDGGTDAVTIEDDNAAAHESAACTVGTYRSGAALAGELWVKAGGSAFIQIQLAFDSTYNVHALAFDPRDGEIAVASGDFTSTQVDSIDGWWRVRFEHAGDTGSDVRLRVHPAIGTSFPTFAVATTGSATIYAPAIHEADGRRRVGGLEPGGLGFVENAYLAGAKIDVGISPVRIVETPGPTDLDAATSVFTADPEAVADLTASLSASATSATVRSSSGLVEGGHYHIGTEVIRVDGISGTSLTIARGQWGTTAQAHPLEATDATPTIRRLRAAPRTYEGRRAWLYAHTADELDLVDEGSIVWRGTIAADPQLEGGDGTTWIANVDSRWSLLDQEVGSGNDKSRKIAGVYYPGTRAFLIGVQWTSDATPYGAVTGSTELRLAGRFTSNLEWAQYVAAALNADSAISSAGFEFIGAVEDGRWTLHVRIPSPTALYPQVYGGSPVDGWAAQRLRGLLQPEGVSVDTVIAGQTYQINWAPPVVDEGVPPDELRREPRTVNFSAAPEYRSDTDSDVTTYLASDVYLDSVRGLEVDASLTFSQRQDADGEDVPPHSVLISSVDSATGRARCGVTPRLLAVGQWVQEITVTTRLVPFSGATLAELRDALVADAPALANAGARPFVTDDDLADWTDVVDAIVDTNPELYDRRQYVYDQGVRATDVLEHEAALYGCFYRLDAEGKVDLRPLTIDTQPVDPDTHTLSDEEGTILSVDGFGTLTSGDDGNINVVEYKTHYDHTADEHRGYIRTRSAEGVSEVRRERVIEIAPKSRSFGDRAELDAGRALLLAQTLLAFFGGRIHHYTFSVPLKRFGVLIGDKVEVTCSALPWAGARRANGEGGLSSVPGIVVGRDWSDIASGVGRLTVLVSSTIVSAAGYSPSGRVASATGAGTSWTLELEENRYAPAGRTDASYFKVGYRVTLREWDSASPTSIEGTVDDVIGNEVSVELDASWSGLSGATYILIFSASDESGVADEQLTRYVSIASSTGRRIVPGGDAQARVFAP